MADTLRIALIGAGGFGRKHLSVMEEVAGDEMAGFALAGIADPAPAARELAQARGVPWHADAAALLDAVRPDGAIVAAPNHLHVPCGLACIARGVPVLVEKPVAETPDGGLILHHAARQAGVAVLVGHHRRHNPLLEAAREVVASGRLGRVLAVNLTCLLRKPDSYFAMAWRREPGGGPVLINLVHEIDTLRFLLGDIASVQAITAHAGRDLAVADTAAIALRFASGALGTIILSDATEAPWSWEMSSGENAIYPRQPVDHGVIAGTAGSLSLPHLDLWRHAAAPDQERGWTAPMARERIAVPPGDAYQRQLRHFGRVIRGAEAPRVTAADAARSLAVCLAVQQSAREARAVAPASLVPD